MCVCVFLRHARYDTIYVYRVILYAFVMYKLLQIIYIFFHLWNAFGARVYKECKNTLVFFCFSLKMHMEKKQNGNANYLRYSGDNGTGGSRGEKRVYSMKNWNNPNGKWKWNFHLCAHSMAWHGTHDETREVEKIQYQKSIMYILTHTHNFWSWFNQFHG